MADEVRDALRRLVYGLVVVGARTADEVNGMTANWVTQLSFEPRLLGVAVEQDAHTLGLIREGRVFSVNLIPKDRPDLAERFVRPQRRVGAKFEGEVGFHPGPATGAPFLDAHAGAVECRLVAEHPVGDHVLVVGEVVGGEVGGETPPLALADLGWHYGG
jgi:flavin reductase (DIM6/NTAB) family NADH-FMN oxidoreductase RutF